MYRDGQLRDISEVSEVGVTITQQFRHLGPFTHPLSSSPSVDHDRISREWEGKTLLVIAKRQKDQIMRHSFNYKNSLIQQFIEQFLSLPH